MRACAIRAALLAGFTFRPLIINDATLVYGTRARANIVAEGRGDGLLQKPEV